MIMQNSTKEYMKETAQTKLEPEEKKELNDIAKNEGRTLSSQIRYIIVEFLKKRRGK